MTIQEFVDHIKAMPRSDKPALIAIDGGGGAGKSTFTQALSVAMGSAPIVQIDDFFCGDLSNAPKPKDPPNLYCPELDYARFEKEVLEPLSKGLKAEFLAYGWEEGDLTEKKTVEPAPWILCEGCFMLKPEISHYFSLKIYLEAPKEVRIARLRNRDGDEHVKTHWLPRWIPEDEHYQETINPKSLADLVLDSEKSNFSAAMIVLSK